MATIGGSRTPPRDTGKLVPPTRPTRRARSDLTENLFPGGSGSNAWERECKSDGGSQRDLGRGWVSAEKAPPSRSEEIEEHLAKQVEAHEAEPPRIAQGKPNRPASRRSPPASKLWSRWRP